MQSEMNKMRFDCSILSYQEICRLLELLAGENRRTEYDFNCISCFQHEKSFLWLNQSYIYSAIIFTRIKSTISFFQKYGRILLRKLILCVRMRGRNKNVSVNDFFPFIFA